MDPLTDIVLGAVAIVGAENIVPTIASFANSIAEFFGEAGTTAIFDSIEALGTINLRDIGTNIIFDGGQIANISLPEIIPPNMKVQLINSLNTIVGVMGQKGVDATTSAGKEILFSTFDAVKNYGPGLTASAIGTYVGSELAHFASIKADDIATTVKDRVADRLGNILP